MVLLIDNYDSFSYNLYQLVGALNNEIMVVRNDGISIDEIERLSPNHIIVSPGPGRPSEAGICETAINHFAGSVPILGVCLGHQAICEAFGADIVYAKKLMHGKESIVTVDNNCPIFKGIGNKITAARYHSLAVERKSLPECIKITAEADDGEIMAVQHNEYALYGVQFHPESIMTPEGKQIIANFLGVRI